MRCYHLFGGGEFARRGGAARVPGAVKRAKRRLLLERGSERLQAYLWAAVLFAGVSFFGLTAKAGDATWNLNGTGDFGTAGNWTPATVPTGTAFFGLSNQNSVSLSSPTLTSIGGWTFNAGASNYTFTVGNSAALTFTGAGIVINGGSATITNNSDMEFSGGTAGSATIINNNYILFSGGTGGSATITNNNGGTLVFETTPQSATITNNAGGLVDLSLITGPIGGQPISAGSIAGAGNFYIGANQLTVGSNNLSTTVSGVISDCDAGTCVASQFAQPASGGSLIKVGTGTLTLSGTNTYTGATTVNGGILEVDGSIATSSGVTANSGGTLSGTGTVSGTQVNGGTLAPGNPVSPTGTLAITGNLAFQSAATYMITINGANTSNTSVSGGSATLGGASVALASGSSIVLNHTYTILTASGGLVGTFNPIVTDGAYRGAVSNVGNSVDVTFTLAPSLPPLPPGAPTNVGSVANAIDNFTAGGGTLPTSLSNLISLSGAQLQTALMQLDGEASTDAEKGAFELMNQFLGLMLDPFVDGRFGTSGGPIGFAPDQQASFPPDIALAYASVLKAPPPSFDQRWTAWGSGFGASSTTSGNGAIGSNNVTTADYGFAGGMDYHATPNTLYGFALAGAGTNWNLAQGLGTGRSDAFQAGVYGKSYWGPAYVAAALAFTNNWFSTNRTALGDELTANFAGQSYGGRLEAGYRYAMPMGGAAAGVTPYAAIQTQWFHTPTYSETDLSGGGLGLTYNATTANDTRSELGARFDDPTLLSGMPLILRARLAWAHDWVSNPALDAVFQSLPGSSFIVNGATPPKDSALASAGAQYFLSSAWSFTAKFDGEFASSSQTYGGSGTLRYTW